MYLLNNILFGESLHVIENLQGYHFLGRCSVGGPDDVNHRNVVHFKMSDIVQNCPGDDKAAVVRSRCCEV